MEEMQRDSTGTPPPSAPTSEAPPSEQPTSRRRGGGQKRKSTSLNSGGGSSNPQTSSKRQAREKPPTVPFPSIYMNGPLTRARVQPNSSNSFSPSEVTVKSEAEAREAAAKADEMSRLSENWEAMDTKIEAEYEAIRSRDENIHVVPVHAGWFSWTKIHSLEKRMLPSFFSGKTDIRTPEIYMEIRNWIMKKFHLNPSVQIELKNLSELTAGELDARQEVMEFLDYWGLINYHPFPQNEPTAMTIDADETERTGSLVEKLFKFETEKPWNPMVPRTNATMPAMSSGLFPESVIADELVKSAGPSVEYHCNSCSADCSRKRYHCQKQADFDLCTECFNNGKFSSNMSPSDFIIMEPAEAGGVTGGKWTDQETLLLLEAIEIFRDNWSEISEHVATKTKAQCILHFVQMPIEDAFLNFNSENIDAPKENELPIGKEDSSPKAEQANDTALKDIPENKESQDCKTDNQSSSYLTEISKADDVNESDGSCEVNDSFALKALKEAFEVVGSVPSPGERLSFAESDNPVMTLAAFLVRLVDPSIAMASVRNFLKSVSSYQSGEQLAARHCFHLEGLPDDKKNLADSEGAATEELELETLKHENAHVIAQNGDATNAVDGNSIRDDGNDKNKQSGPEEQEKKKDSAYKDQKPVISPSNECGEKSDTVKEPDEMATHKAQPACMSEPSHSDIPEEQTPKGTKESVPLASHSELNANSEKELEDGASARKHSQSKEPLKDEEMISISEENDAELLVMSNSIIEKEENAGDAKAKECDIEKEETVTTKQDLDKLKQAAVTALSAAAVKAKLLADHEEDQIRQLAASLIEKQLCKLEMKLAFFNDMENVVMRVKEQIDRSKQRLFHERAQIIATRFGMPASARPNTQLLPPSRSVAAVTFSSSGSRPFMGVNSLRPPMSRPPGMAPNPSSSTFVPANGGGSSVQPSYSVGTITK